MNKPIDKPAGRPETLRLNGTERTGIRDRVEYRRPRQVADTAVVAKPAIHPTLFRPLSQRRSAHHGMLTAQSGAGAANDNAYNHAGTALLLAVPLCRTGSSGDLVPR